jgi:hypothetical protein
MYIRVYTVNNKYSRNVPYCHKKNWSQAEAPWDRQTAEYCLPTCLFLQARFISEGTQRTCKKHRKMSRNYYGICRQNLVLVVSAKQNIYFTRSTIELLASSLRNRRFAKDRRITRHADSIKGNIFHVQNLSFIYSLFSGVLYYIFRPSDRQSGI